ncbi:polysaccharide biosynthesis/export family protein [Burkholderia cenocepacia]|uniref:polysaccharide biosynthesis/export family protein n=1 Tax=Burkholderia cenocepacia TaxID=95486 RepID=UPI001CF402C3|nr:polysaccharide biosynthesis/export family protein [Burkholderia cenocepacia]MCA7961345.1 polysaccharide biosynthesis/export family protein [Burkholderia cenocepacia]MCF1369849.1 polysaccharide biosynthesis/export family protein [Burkholderia cenocepacia]MCF1386120.1 polysaccharide biosynthesis/export family protein [Burkholderia cenocepacia]MEC4772405.1 polysaccharide biosynthesis/export family protein [Burkholderia cenocepacia]
METGNGARPWAQRLRPALTVLPAILLLSACAVEPGMHMDLANDASRDGGIATRIHESDLTVSTHRIDAASVGRPQGSSASGDAASIPIGPIDGDLIAAQRREARAQDERSRAALLAEPAPYAIGVGDVLQITVWDRPELAAAQGSPGAQQARPADPPAGFVVDQAGNLAFPYAGELHVAGMSTREIQAALRARLSKWFVAPQLTVRVASYRANRVYIDGEVHAPGAQPLNDTPMTLLEAVTRAGGFTADADQSRMTLVRAGVAYPVDLPGLIRERLDPSRIVLRNGDLLQVGARDQFGVYVMGEVNKPTTALPLRNGRLTLADALSQAGSVNQGTSDPKQTYVIRAGEARQAQVFHLDGRSPVSMVLANEFELQPRDVVYVDSTKLARFGRVLAQLLPAINAGLTAAIVTK